MIFGLIKRAHRGERVGLNGKILREEVIVPSKIDSILAKAKKWIWEVECKACPSITVEYKMFGIFPRTEVHYKSFIYAM
jgi:hypothetical protein